MTPVADDETRIADDASRLWWQDLRWITALVVLAIVVSLAWGLFGPEPRIVVSRETTFITESLRADGLPDYVAHMLDLTGRGTPPEENAAVGVLQATWGGGLDAARLAAVCAELGIPDTPPDTAPLVKPGHDQRLADDLHAFLGPLPTSSAAIRGWETSFNVRMGWPGGPRTARPWPTGCGAVRPPSTSPGTHRHGRRTGCPRPGCSCGALTS